MSDRRSDLEIGKDKLDSINNYLTDPDNVLTAQLLGAVEKFGGPEAINQKAAENGSPESLMARLKEMDSPYMADLEWLAGQKSKGAFVSMADYCASLGVDPGGLNQANAVTLEISAMQFFPWLMAQARQCIEKRELMPGRVIRVRNMAEQSADKGDLLATALAMNIMGCSWVETLDTNGTDGSNIHLGGPETITGYFGGIGQPNRHPVKWLEEYLHFYTTYGVKQVLNINPGTVLLAYMLNKLGVDNEFKISVFMGNDNPYSIMWTLMTAKLFSRPDDTTSLVGFNLSNSVDNQTIIEADQIRAALGLTRKVRFEHHITETYQHIVIQPYNRRDELVELAQQVPNIAAKHEGGEPDIEKDLQHPSSILDYFMPKAEIESQGLMDALLQNYLHKHHSVKLTADALLKSGTAVVAAQNLHK